MLHLIWYIIVGLIAGWAAKSLMHMHLSLLWTIVLGVVGSIVGGLVTHHLFASRTGRAISSSRHHCVDPRRTVGAVALAQIQAPHSGRIIRSEAQRCSDGRSSRKPTSQPVRT